MVPVVWMYVCMAALGVVAVGAFLWAWGRREARRAEALEALDRVGPWGIVPLNKLLKAYAIGNYLGKDSVTRVIHEIIDDLKGDGIDKILVRIGWKMVDQFVKDVDSLKILQDKIAGKVTTKLVAPTADVNVQ